MSASTTDEEFYEDDFEIEESSAGRSNSKKSPLDILPQLVARQPARHESFSSYEGDSSHKYGSDEELEEPRHHHSPHTSSHKTNTSITASSSSLHAASPPAYNEPISHAKPHSVEHSPGVMSSHHASRADSSGSNGVLHRSNVTSVEVIHEPSESLVRGSHTFPMQREEDDANKREAGPSAITTSSARTTSSHESTHSSSSSRNSSASDNPAPPLALRTQQHRPSGMQPPEQPVTATNKVNEESSITTFYQTPAHMNNTHNNGVVKEKPTKLDERRLSDEEDARLMSESEIEEEREMSIPSPENTHTGQPMTHEYRHEKEVNKSKEYTTDDDYNRDERRFVQQEQRSPTPPEHASHPAAAQPTSQRTNASREKQEKEDQVSRTQLEERIAQLKAAIVDWNKRIEAKEAELETRQRRSRRAHEANTATSNNSKTKNNSNTTLYPTSWSRQGMQADVERCQQELARLRAENATLEQHWSTYEGKVVNVMFLLARAAAQLSAMQEKLRTLKKTKLMLEQRDRRAAHVIEETSRRLPAREEREWHQVNDTFYSQAQLQRKVHETQQAIEANRRTAAMMEEKCAELEATAQRRHLSHIGSKEYKALKQMHAEQQRTMTRLRNAIAVYSGQRRPTISVPPSRPGSGLNDGVPDSGPIGLVNTPVRGNSANKQENRHGTNANSARRRSLSSLHSSRVSSAHGGASSTAESLSSQYESAHERRVNMQREIDALARKIELCSGRSRDARSPTSPAAKSPSAAKKNANTPTTTTNTRVKSERSVEQPSESLLPSRGPRGVVRSSPAKPPSALNTAASPSLLGGPRAGGEASAAQKERLAALPSLMQDGRVTQSAGQAQRSGIANSNKESGASNKPMILPDIHRNGAAKSPTTTATPPQATAAPLVADKTPSSAKEKETEVGGKKTQDRLVVTSEALASNGAESGEKVGKAISTPPQVQSHIPEKVPESLTKTREDTTHTPASKGLASSPEDVVEAIEAGESGRSTPLWLR